MTRPDHELITVERDDSSSTPSGDSAGGSAVAAPPGYSVTSWSPEQHKRLEAEWRTLQRAYAYHPVVRILPLQGDPPDQYQVEYRLRHLVMTDAGQLEYASSCAMHIWLPPAFPLEPPLIRPITRVFHPNIIPQGVNLSRIWGGPNTSMLDVVRAVGALVALQQYDVDAQAVWNDAAMEWIQANPRHVPVDRDADLAPTAGGDPLTRITRFGPRTMEQVRSELKRLCDSLISPEGSPPPREIQTVCARAHNALALFHAPGLPNELAQQALELDDWARQLPASTPAWEQLRRHRGTAALAFEAAQQMRESEKGLLAALAAVDALVAEAPRPSIAETVRLLPPIDVLQGHQKTLEELIQRAAQQLNDARAAYTRLQGLPRFSAGALSEQLQQLLLQPHLQQHPQPLPSATSSSVVPLPAEPGALPKRLESEAARAQQLVAEAADRLKEAFVRLDPLSGRARIQHAALRRLADWRRYIAVIARAEVAVHTAEQLGPEGLHAYFIENESGRFGPFELEQHVQIGSLDIAVRLTNIRTLEMIDAQTGSVIKRGDGGIIVKQVDDPASGAKFPTTFRYGGDCDELASQLSDCIYEATQGAEAILVRIRPGEGWLGRYQEMLSAAAGAGRLQADHQTLLTRWSAVCDDLFALKRFKERLATLRLLQRIEVLGPSLLARQAEALRILDDTNQRIAVIVASSNRDVETGRLLIPHRSAREYPELLQRRDTARQTIDTVHHLLALAADDVRRRINDSNLRGVAGVPKLNILTVIPAEWQSLSAMSADDQLTRRLTELESVLNSPLRPLDAFPVTLLEEVPDPAIAPSRAEMTDAAQSPAAGFYVPEPGQQDRAVEELEVIDIGEAELPSSGTPPARHPAQPSPSTPRMPPPPR